MRCCSSPRAPAAHYTQRRCAIITVAQGHDRELVAAQPKLDDLITCDRPSCSVVWGLRPGPAHGANQHAYMHRVACSLGHVRGHSARPCQRACSRGSVAQDDIRVQHRHTALCWGRT